MDICVSAPVEHGPARPLLLARLGLALLVLALAATADPLGRVLLLPLGLGLAATAARDLLLGPALCADADGVHVVDGLHRRSAGWEQLQRLRVVTDRRSPLLELDLGEQVVVLSRGRLGAAPSLVLAELEELRSDR